MPGCLAASLRRPANNLLNPLGSSVVGSFTTVSLDSDSAAGAGSDASVCSDTSCAASVAASVGSATVVGFLRANNGFVLRTCTGALAATF